MRKLTALLLLLAVPAYAEEELRIPLWVEMEIKGETYACYDFEGARSLRLLENRCQVISLENKDLKNRLDVMTESYEAAQSAYKKEAEATRQAQELANKLQTERDNAVKDAAKSKGSSVIGGGFPWLLVTFAAGVLAGGYLGLTLAKK